MVTILDDTALLEKVLKAQAFDHAVAQEMQGAFALMAQGRDLVIKASARPDIEQQTRHSGHVMSGMMIVYLFAMWEQHFAREDADVKDYFTADEQQTFYAFKHMRNVFAHNIRGERKSNKNASGRMSRAAEFDAQMSSKNPLRGVSYDQDTMTLTFPDAFLECQNFLTGMARHLGAERFPTIGAGKPVRTVGKKGREVSHSR